MYRVLLNFLLIKKLCLLMLLFIFLLLIFFSYHDYFGGTRSFSERRLTADGYYLMSYVSLGNNPQGVWVIFLHGNRKKGQEHPLYTKLLNNITDQVSILAIDLRGFGNSPFGDLSRTDKILDRSSDIYVATQYLNNNYNVKDDSIILMGHSLGSLMVLKASGEKKYLHVIPIGPTDFNELLKDTERIQFFINKFARNTSIQMRPHKFIDEGKGFTPQAFFTPCPSSPITLVFGSRDYSETLIHRKDTIPLICRKKLEWFVIPFSNHMYYSEGSGFIKSIKQTISTSFLIWNINQIIDTTVLKWSRQKKSL